MARACRIDEFLENLLIFIETMALLNSYDGDIAQTDMTDFMALFATVFPESGGDR